MGTDDPEFIAGMPVFRYVPKRPPWRTVVLDNDIVHIVPSQDLVIHTLREPCACGPSERIDSGHEECDHPDIWVHQHHPLDGRAYPDLR